MRLIDADALIAELLRMSFLPALVRATINRMSTVDVIRCKDCKYRVDDYAFVCGHYCVKRQSNGGYFCEDNDFCSYGERKEK